MTVGLATKGKLVRDKDYGVVVETDGEIQLEPERWQLCSIPVQFGYFNTGTGAFVHDEVTPATIKNYVLDQIEYMMPNPIEEYIEVASCHIGDENKSRSFIPGFTNESSSQNFPLAYDDGGTLEYTAFWIKSIHINPITIGWGYDPGP